jgi:hypothetical protein
VFTFAAVVTDISLRAWDHALIPSGPVIGVLLVAIVSLAASFTKYRGHYDPALRNTIVIASVLAFGLGFLGSHMGSARSAMLRAQCKQNMKLIGKAFWERADKDRRFPAAIDRSPTRPPQSWRVTILPQVSAGIHTGYDASEPWDAKANLPAARTEIEVYSCPAVGYPRDEQNRWLSPFALVTGPGTIFPDGTALRIKDITDGTSSTLLAVEAVGLRIVWSEPRDCDVSRNPIGLNLPGSEFGTSPGLLSSYHPRLTNALLADGSVMVIGNEIDPQVLKALTTAAAHDIVRGPAGEPD